tara:strand:+ start:106 stop:567 length:462 start_codon:yes stop_codon:yes gene_type:complete
MKSLIFLLFIIPSASLASSDIRETYIKAVKDFSLCGNALMPWGDSTWRPDEIEKPYVEQSKLNQIKMKAEIDDKFYTEGILSKLFADLTANFYAETADITAQLEQLPSEDHAMIWSSLFELEKEARLIREELMIDFHLHAEIIKFCATGLTKP